MFNFDHQFEIHDDLEVLRRMGMTYRLERGKCSAGDLSTLLNTLPIAVHHIITGTVMCSRYSVVMKNVRLDQVHCARAHPHS